MKYRSLFLLFAVILMGAGCTPTDTPTPDDTVVDDLPDQEYCYEMTAHGSCISTAGVDEALLGSWTLTSVTVSTRAMNFSGHTLSINSDDYVTDYSTEQYNVENMPDHIGSCFFAGGTNGYHYADSEIDPNSIVYLPDGSQDLDALVINNYLSVNRAGGEITSECSSAQTITTQVTNMALGTGPVDASVPIDNAVRYEYTMSDDWSTLTINALHAPVVYSYARVN